MDILEKISYETMRFMRGSYKLDEIGDGKEELKFKQGKKTILTVYIRKDKFTFLLIFGKKEREHFEAHREEFSQYVCGYYDNSKTYHDGKWMFFDVTTLEQLEDIKKLIQIKKKPNRKPFPRENAVAGKCGHRCDLCIHYIPMAEEQRGAIEPLLTRMWGIDDWSMRCGGCGTPECHCTDDTCEPMTCAAEKGLTACVDCGGYPCMQATVGDSRSRIHTEVHYADEITWAILPYVPWQYEE